jgi:hypothetical protein
MTIDPLMKTKVVLRQLPNELAVPHCVYQYRVADLRAKGITDPDDYMKKKADKGIEDYKVLHPEYEKALFVVYDMDPTEVLMTA